MYVCLSACLPVCLPACQASQASQRLNLWPLGGREGGVDIPNWCKVSLHSLHRCRHILVEKRSENKSSPGDAALVPILHKHSAPIRMNICIYIFLRRSVAGLRWWHIPTRSLWHWRMPKVAERGFWKRDKATEKLSGESTPSIFLRLETCWFVRWGGAIQQPAT